MMRPYIDVHAHIGMTVSRSPAVGQTVGRYMGRMASAGVMAAVLCPTAGGPQANGVLDTRREHEAVSAALRAFPDRFPVGLGIAEVRHGEAGVVELERAMTAGGLSGFMCHPGLSGHSLGAELHPFLEAAAVHSGVCLLHQAGSTANIAAYARRFPSVTFIIGHVSLNRGAALDAAKHCANLPNVWYDIAQMPLNADESWNLRSLLSDLDGGRLLFGSDTPYYDFRLTQSLVESSDISESSKDAVAFENAAALIRRFAPGWELPTEPVSPPQVYTEEELWAANGARLL